MDMDDSSDDDSDADDIAMTASSSYSAAGVNLAVHSILLTMSLL